MKMAFNYETRNTAQRKRDKLLGRERERERERQKQRQRERERDRERETERERERDGLSWSERERVSYKVSEMREMEPRLITQK